MKGWEQFHVPKALSTNINMDIWVQGGLCVFAQTLGFGFGCSLPVLSLLASFSVRSLHAECPHTTAFVAVVLCSLGAGASPQLPLSNSGLFYPSHFLPLSPRVTFLFSGERKLLQGGRRTCPGTGRSHGMAGLCLNSLLITPAAPSLPQGSAPGTGGAGLLLQLGGECGSSGRGWCEGRGETPSAGRVLQG